MPIHHIRSPRLRGYVDALNRGTLSERLWDNTANDAFRSKSFQSRLAVAIDPNGGRCLLTNDVGSPRVINKCHLVPTTAKEPLMRKVENAWGMPPGSLNVHAYPNIAFLRKNLHIEFTNGHLMLLPQLEDLETMTSYTSASERKGDIHELWVRLGKTTFGYNLIPTPTPQYPLFRFNSPLTTLDDFSVHEHPYTTLGKLKSHVQPQYVVMNAGKKLEKGGFDDLVERLEAERPGTQKTMDMVSSMYKKWTA